jgi:hypothetical protein
MAAGVARVSPQRYVQHRVVREEFGPSTRVYGLRLDQGEHGHALGSSEAQRAAQVNRDSQQLEGEIECGVSRHERYPIRWRVDSRSPAAICRKPESGSVATLRTCVDRAFAERSPSHLWTAGEASGGPPPPIPAQFHAATSQIQTNRAFFTPPFFLGKRV